MPEDPITFLSKQSQGWPDGTFSHGSSISEFTDALLALAEHNRISDSDDHLEHPSPCFECEVQKLLSRCVMFGHRLRQGNGEAI